MSRFTLLLLLASTVGAQTPQTQPLLQASDFTHAGTITLPPGIGNPNCLAVEGDLMYVCTYFGAGKTGMAVVRIPASGFGQATLVSGPSQLPNLFAFHIGGTYNDIIAGGALLWQGRLICSGWTYYDGGGGQIKSHWANCDPSQTATGPFQMQVTDVGSFSNSPSLSVRQMGEAEAAELAKAPPESLLLGGRTLATALGKTWPRQTFVGGYMGFIPAEWRASFGFVALTGQCCVPIIGRTSFGPSVSAFNPADVGGPEPTPSKMLVGYPIEHKTLGEWDAKPPSTYYGGTDQLGSVGFPSGTRSVLFTGRHGDTFCYGPGTPDPKLVGTPGPGAYPYCYDPVDFLQGNHGPLYRPTMWAYDANDLLKVKQGTLKPWEVFPYAKWTIPGMNINAPNYLRAGYYEDTKRRYYVGSTDSTTVHVIQVSGGTSPPPATKANITVNPSVTHQTMRGWELTAQAEQFGPGFSTYIGPVLDKVVEAGFDRVRLEVRSGSENTQDYFGEWLKAGAQFSGTAYDTWRQRRYEIINDNADPAIAAAGRFHWSELDDTTDRIVVPFRTKLLAARGETLYVNLTVVSFYNAVGNQNVFQTPSEYAEFILETFKHMQARYGWVPDGVNLILEPDNTSNWTGPLLGQVAAATVARLTAAGFKPPDILGPSTTNMTTASTWGPQALAVTGNGIKELSYHRYSGVSTTALQAIASAVQKSGIASSMLECWPAAGCTSNYNTLHEDLTVGRASAWQQSVFVDTAGVGGHSATYVNLAAPTTATFTTPTLTFKQYYQSVRRGAVRVGTTSTTTSLAPLAFRNVNGSYAVVVKATAAGPIVIGGLPAGTYSLTSTAGNAPDQTIVAGGVVATNAVSAGVLTVASKVGGPPPDPVNCVGNWGRVPNSESTCVNSMRTFQELFTVTTPASNGGTACPNPLTRSASEACVVPSAQTTVTVTSGGVTQICTVTAGTPPTIVCK